MKASRKLPRSIESELRAVRAVKALGAHRLWLRFDNGDEGEIDMKPFLEPFTNLFAALEDPDYFARVRVSRAARTIAWPNGVELDPDVLHSRVTGKKIRWAR
ncbi:MAG TPA: DUF2442 domain-containing protein [Candidatus Polarisedimenticolaceae bacterium]|nr:DUF2442 domain-containing protein [Candidatus Polarisedimenticolaceae bacterium]